MTQVRRGAGSGDAQSGFTKLLAVVAGVVAALALAEAALRASDIVGCPIFESNSYCGYLARPHQHVGGLHRYSINGYGFRGPQFSEAVHPGETRIAFIGDSITFGGGHVADEETFVALVGRTLGERTGQNVEAINLSEPGWGIQNMEGYVAHMGVHHAGVIVWVISMADFRRGENTIEKLNFLTKEPPLCLICLGHFAFNFAENRVRRLANGWGTPIDVETEGEQTIQQNLDALRRGLALVHAGDAVQLLVFVPVANSIRLGGLDLARYRAVATSQDVATLDLSAAFANRERRLFYDGVHLSPEGHALVAHAVTEALHNVLQGRLSPVAASG